MLLSLRFFFSSLAVVVVALPAVLGMFLLTPFLLFGRSGQRAYFLAARSMCGCVWSAWGWVTFAFWKTKFTCENEQDLLTSLRTKKRIMVVANHRSWADIFVLSWLAHKAGSTKHSVYLAKRSLIYVPVVGWGMYLAGMMMLRRSWKSDKNMIQRATQRFVDHRFGYWVYLFPEGTRLKARALEASQEFQKKRGLAVHSEVLQPRVKGFSALLNELPELTDVLDVSISYCGENFSFVSFLAGMCPEVRVRANLHPVPLTHEISPAEFLEKSFAAKEVWLKKQKR